MAVVNRQSGEEPRLRPPAASVKQQTVALKEAVVEYSANRRTFWKEQPMQVRIQFCVM
jgi:hypothetical protein